MSDFGIYLQPPNTMSRIDELWAFVAVDPEDSNEGVCAFFSHHFRTWIPLIAADTKRLEQMRAIAQELQNAEPNKKIKLVKFSNREEVEELNAVVG